MDAPQLRIITEADLLAMGEDANIEIIDGEVIETSPVGMKHHIVAGNLAFLLETYVRKHKNGLVFMDGLTCILDTEQGTIKGSQVPDVCFIRKRRIPADFDLRRPFPGSPDFVVEVISPSENPLKTLKKIRAYLRFGSEEAWMIYPDPEEIHQYRADAPDRVQVYRVGDTILMPTLFPQLTLSAADIFALPDLE